MLEMFVVKETVFFLTGVMIGIGAITRLITGISLKRLVRAASNMSKSNHPLMRLVRAKFEHGCMVSDKVQNVGAFVEKYLYEYRVLGVRLHTWRQWAKGSIWLCLIFGAAGTALAYAAGEREQGLYRYAVLGGAGAVALFILRMLADDAYQLEAAKTYMVDFLENTYAHRYAKANQKEIQVTVQRADEVSERSGAEENEAAYSGQAQRAISEETVPASAATVNAVSVKEKRYTEEIDKERYAEDSEVSPIEKRKKFMGRHYNTHSQVADEVQADVKVQQQAVQAAAKVGQANANRPDEMQRQQAKMQSEDAAGSRFQQEDAGERLEPTKEARIREILEEFLA